MTPSAVWQRLSTVLPGFGQGGHSLSRQLLLWVLLPQVVLWLAGGVAAYHLAASYANEAIDSSLLQASRSLARQLKPIGTGLLIDFPKAAQDVLEADPQDRQFYMVSSPPGRFILGNRALPAPPDHVTQTHDTPFFYDGTMPADQAGDEGLRLRVVALHRRFGEGDVASQQTMLVQVARSRANREELARRILVDILLPLSTLVLLMTVIVSLGIRAGLAPLTRLRHQVEGRAPTDLTPLQLAAAPRELWSLAGAINTLLAEIRHHVDRQKRFTADAAHQLRTPLAGLKSQTELALHATTDPDLHQRLQRVHDSAVRSTHVVSQLLALARAEPSASDTLPRTPVDLTQLASETTAECVPRALRRGVDLGLDESPSKPLWVLGHHLLLREALLNLIDNALEYSGAGSEVTVRTHLSAQGEAVELTVTDNGPGIAAGEKDRVFERFHRATDMGNGCGLGLAIVQEIVHRHGGTVVLQDANPRGLRVVVSLPRALSA